ncbi:MAG TPA: hypothetical protein VEP90_08100 [Methylomirabilota bacterium]|nr:hypothetical protein [Methylomirabilota bacterium]
MKIAIIVDNLEPERRRYCFWEEQLRSFPDIQVELISLSEQITEHKTFDLDAYDIIIFNWDVINNDVWFNADRCQIIVKNDKEDFAQFVRNGGILILEDQTRHWIPVQDAYDALFASQVVVQGTTKKENEKPAWAPTARVNKRLKDHPLIHNLPAILYSAYSLAPDFQWFPPNSVRQRALQGLHPTKIYSGAFQKWKSEWLPLIYTDDSNHPILLVKADGLGLWVVSTMFFASANIRELIENLLKAKDNRSDIRLYHSHYRVVRIAYASSAVGILLALTGAVFFALSSHFIAVDIPFNNSVGGTLAVSLLISFLLWILSFLLRYVTSNIRSALNK